MADFPAISLVVPNYNGGKTIAATLQSLIDQNYPNLQIIVVDGGSKDNSVEIIKQFESHIAWWVSEKDRGQSDAINKGLARCTGDIVNWLCSDDLLEPGALSSVAQVFVSKPEVQIVCGTVRVLMTAEGIEFERAPTRQEISYIPVSCRVGQPACFYRRSCLDRPLAVRENLHFTMDYELWCYFSSRGYRWELTGQRYATAIEDGNNKTAVAGRRAATEWEGIYREYCGERIPLTWWFTHLLVPIQLLFERARERWWRWPLLLLRRGLTQALAPFYGKGRIREMDFWIRLYRGDSE